MVLAADAIEALRAALQSAVNVAVQADARDQTEACLIGAQLLGLWKPATPAEATAAGSPLLAERAEAVSRVRDVAVIATAAINTASALDPPPDDLITFVGRSILGSTQRLDFVELSWGPEDYAVLASVLPGCVALESITIVGMAINDADAAAVFAELPGTVRSISISCAGVRRCPDLSKFTTLRVLALGGCSELESPPDVSTLSFLERLDLYGCTALTSPPTLTESLSEHLQIVNLVGCNALRSLPDASTLKNLRALVEPQHLKKK